jgi:hypothetical protein
MPPGDGISGRVLVVALLLLVAGVAAPALAQEETPTPTPSGDETATGDGTATSNETAGGTETAAGSGATGLVVDPDGEETYGNISAAVAAAAPGDTVTVRPGTYEETVQLRKDITLVAPGGAVLDGRSRDGDAGIVIVGDAAPTIRGFTLVGHTVGIAAPRTTGDWTVRNVTVADSERVAVHAARSSGDWTLGEATLSGTTGVAVGAFRSHGDWTVSRVSITGTDGVAVNARAATGDWRVADTAINGTAAGGTLTTEWTGTAVYAGDTTGAWAIEGAAFADNAVPVVNATGADGGDATRNFWSGSTSEENTAPDDACAGAVDCGGALPIRPTGAVGDPSFERRAPAGGGGLPLVGIGMAVLALVGLVGGGFLAVQYVGADPLLGPLEGLLGAAGGGGGSRQITLENVGDDTVTCRVECLTDDGVQFQYDLTLKQNESREARELPASGRFAVKVEVDGANAAEEFASATDVVVQVVPGDCEVAAA